MGEKLMSRLRFRWMAIAVVAVSLPLFAMQGPPQTGAQPGDDPHIAEEQAAERQALGFLGYLDQGRYADSYAYTGMLIRAQLDREAFSSKLRKHGSGRARYRGVSSSMPATPPPCQGPRRDSMSSCITTPALPTGQIRWRR